MEEEILKILSQKEMSISEIQEEMKNKEVTAVLKGMVDSGLIFVKKNQNYSITLLGKILALGLKETYEKIVKKKDLFDFFRTRVPSVIPDELLSKFKICEDFQILGKPDLVPKQKEIMNKAIGTIPHVEKEMCVSASVVFKPPVLYAIGVLKKKPKIYFIIPKTEYEKSNTFIKVAQKFTNWKTRIIETKNQYIGFLYIDGKFCFFGFDDLENKLGWDALISTKSKECIQWVKENFDYTWDTLAKEP